MNVNDMTSHVSSRLDYCDVKHAPARDDKAHGRTSLARHGEKSPNLRARLRVKGVNSE
jgi:hypothetical protein